jgi:hypothetical protein
MKLAVVCALVAIGCGGKHEPSADDLLKQLGPTIEPKLANAEKIAKRPLPEPTGKITPSGPPMKWVEYFPPDPVTGNATIAFDTDLKNLREYSAVELRFEHLTILNDCFAMVRDKTTAATASGRAAIRDDFVMTRTLPECAALKYLVVVRLDEFQSTKYVDKEHFEAGHARATALVFDLDTAAYLGGVTFASSSNNYIKDPDSDLRNGFHDALKAALNKAMPGADLH